MRKLTAVALLAIAVGAIIHFWPRDRESTVARAPWNATSRSSPVATSGHPSPAPQPAAAPASPPERAAESAPVARASTSAARIEVHAPRTVRAGDTFPVTIDVQALRGIRQLAFSVSYKKSILELAGSSPGALARQGGTSVQFEEVSDGSLYVRVDLDRVLVGAGTLAVVELKALKAGVSPLVIQGLAYVEDGGRDPSNTPTVYEGSVTVE